MLSSEETSGPGMTGCSISLVGFIQRGTGAELLLHSTAPLIGRAWTAPVTEIGTNIRQAEVAYLDFQLDWCADKGGGGVASGALTLDGVVEPTNREYLVVVEVDCGLSRCDFEHHIQFVRQSGSYLRQQYSFNKPGGYWICGPRSIDLGAGNQIVRKNRRFFTTEGYSAFFKAGGYQSHDFAAGDMPVQGPKELRELFGLVTFLYSFKPLTGPTNGDYSDFERQSPGVRLNFLRDNLFAVQCSGFRDLFVSLALSRGFKVRCVDAFNSPPAFPDLVPFGHSTAEVWLPSLKVWCLFDPWFGGLIPFLDGLPLSLGRFPLSPHEEQGVSFVSATPYVFRKTLEPDGAEKYRKIDLSRIPVTGFSDLGECEMHVQPGYLDYFQYVEVRDCAKSVRLLGPLLQVSTVFRRLLGIVHRLFHKDAMSSLSKPPRRVPGAALRGGFFRFL